MTGSWACSSAQRPAFASQFTSKERDAETGLDYFGARYLSSAQGRWTSPDPTLLSVNAFNPQALSAKMGMQDLFRFNLPSLYKTKRTGTSRDTIEDVKARDRMRVVFISIADGIRKKCFYP